MSPEDHTQIYRLVGFYEYLNALQRFDRLLQMTSSQEWETIDQIIKEQDEMAIYTNLSFPLEKARSSLTEHGQKRDEVDTFERRGLNWVMALARVELGAMFAGYSNAASPFEIVQPSQYEMEAYRELLLDGLRTHYWAFVGDARFRVVVAQSRKEPDTATLAYIRRLRIVLGFHDAATRSGLKGYTRVQLAELSDWKNDLDRLQNELIGNIREVLVAVETSETSKKTKTETKFTDFEKGCLAQCKDLVDGKPRVYKVREYDYGAQ